MPQSNYLSNVLFISVVGLFSLAAAMGIGRFAFTPLLPLMIQDGQLNVAQGSWLATANYIGYLVGALTVSRLRFNASVVSFVSLIILAVVTALMALPLNYLWPWFRFIAGVCSAWVFVGTTVWCLSALGKMQQANAGGGLYSGVGIGLFIVGVYCLFATALGNGPADIWMHLGVLTLLASLPLILIIKNGEFESLTKPKTTAAPKRISKTMVGLVISYGIFGFGYILPATFIPELARQIVTNPAVFGLAWPVFGIMGAASTLFAGALLRNSARISRLHIWVFSNFLMGLGALLPSLWLSLTSIVISAILVGGTFMVITLVAVQEIRVRTGANSGAWVGYITTAFALGQILGPVFSGLLLSIPAIAPYALSIGLQVASIGLFASALWLWKLANVNS